MNTLGPPSYDGKCRARWIDSKYTARMASGTCWVCENVAHMTLVKGSESLTSGFWRDTVMGCFRCDNCGALSIAIAKGRPGKQNLLDWLASRSHLQWQPQVMAEVPEHEFPDVPSEIADAAAEAYACREVADACRAAVLLARSVIEAVAKDKGITKGTLLAKIDAMSDMIRPHVRDGAHEVRLFGNDMAHGDFVRNISLEDADLVLTLMSEVLDDVYQSPARVKRAQDARARRQQASQAQDTNLSMFLDLMAKQKLVVSSSDPTGPHVSIQDDDVAKSQTKQD
jgi:hypothetical protein